MCGAVGPRYVGVVLQTLIVPLPPTMMCVFCFGKPIIHSARYLLQLRTRQAPQEIAPIYVQVLLADAFGSLCRIVLYKNMRALAHQLEHAREVASWISFIYKDA